MSLILDGTNGLSDVDGSAATPAIRGSDANTGVFFGSDVVGLSTGGSERVRVDASGNVGIGTSSPAVRLETSGTTLPIFNATSTNRKFVVQETNNANSNAGIAIRKRHDTLHPANHWYGDIQFLGWDGSAFIQGALIEAVAQGTPAASNMPGNLRFSTNGGSASTTERMRIDSSGNLLIGYTSSNGSFKLQVNSQIFATNATISTSDGRYKEDIQSLDGALDLVAQLNPVQFSWKEHPVHNFDRSGPTVGFIAQEVQQVLANKPYLNSIIKANKCVVEPEEKDLEGNVTKEAVTEEFLGIAEGNMIAILTKAIQELKAEFDAYKASHP
jgi:hypothetical protein